MEAEEGLGQVSRGTGQKCRKEYVLFSEGGRRSLAAHITYLFLPVGSFSSTSDGLRPVFSWKLSFLLIQDLITRVQVSLGLRVVRMGYIW